MGNWKGIEVADTAVASAIRKYGPPAHTAQRNKGKTILFYEVGTSEPEERESPKDYAGTRTPARRVRVIQSNGPGTETRSHVSARLVTAGVSPQAFSGGGNPNVDEKIADAEIVTPEELTNEIESETETDLPNGEDETIQKNASTPEEVIQSTEDTDAGQDPREAYKAKYPDRNYEFLDALTVDELDALYQQDKDALGEIKGSGSKGNVVRNDYINHLRTDR